MGLLKKLIYMYASGKMLRLTITHLFMCKIRYQNLYVFAGERNLSRDDSRKKEKIYKQNGLPSQGIRIQPWNILILSAVNIIDCSYSYL